MEANFFIIGNINKDGTIIRINAQLIDSKTEEVFKSFQINGTAEKILSTIDSLAMMAKNFLIITNLKKEDVLDYRHFASTSSPEAYSYFVYAENARWKLDFPTATKLYGQN